MLALVFYSFQYRVKADLSVVRFYINFGELDKDRSKLR